jgi:HTH-type transcriptional regulator, sugar sensing transcriptional regulator
MRTIPATLVKALNNLGLSNYEASVYAALVLFDNAEAKEIIEFLGISKPSVYEALDHLEEMGLAVKRITKPARYSAISPDMAIDLLMDKHRKAADQALEALRALEKEKVCTDKEDALWTIYGDKNIEYKIRELFGKAKQQISCMIGERYVPFIENIKIRDVSLHLIVISDDPELEGKLKKLFPGKTTTIHVISSEQFKVPPPFAPPEFEEIHTLMKVENVLELIVDDEELLMVPPFISGSVSVLNTRNKGSILQMKMMSQLTQRRFIDGGEFAFPPHPVHKKK